MARRIKKFSKNKKRNPKGWYGVDLDTGELLKEVDGEIIGVEWW